MPDNNTDIVELSKQLVELTGKLERLMDSIEVVKEQQDAMADNIAKVKEAVYNSDQGIYARLRELEAWKETNTKAMWIVFATVIGMAATQAWELFGSAGS